LLVVDNVEDLIEHSAIDFKNLISKFLNECEDLSIVLTSRRSLGTLYDSVQG
jgi:predicted ATPase